MVSAPKKSFTRIPEGNLLYCILFTVRHVEVDGAQQKIKCQYRNNRTDC